MRKYIPLFALTIMLTTSAFGATLSEEAKIRYNEYYNNGVTLYKSQNYTSSITEFRKVLRALPYDETVKKALISAYLARAQEFANKYGNFKKASNDIKSALFYLEYWTEGNSVENANIINSAKENLKKLETTIQNEDVIYKNAIVSRQMGELAAAAYDLKQLKSEGYVNKATETLGDIYKSLNNQQKALDEYRKVIKTNKANSSAYFKYALIMDEVGNTDAASEYYNLALKNGENNLQLLENLESLWTSRIEKDPNNAQNHTNLGTVLQKKKDYLGAKEEYLKARALDQTDTVPLYNLASLYNEMNTPNEAILVYDEILAKDSSNITILTYKAIAQEKTKNIKGAISSLKTIIQINPNSKEAKEAKEEISRIVMSNFKGQELIDYLTLEANSSPNDFGAQYNLAYELHKQNKGAEAISYYEKAISLNPKYENSYINLAQIYLNQNNTDKAESVVNRGLSVLATNKNLLNLKTDILNQKSGNLYEAGGKYWDNKNYDLALKEYLKIPNKTPEVLEAIASCYLELNDTENARKYYNELLAKNSANKSALMGIAGSFYKDGNLDNSISYYNKILSLEPENKEVKDTISSIKNEIENKKLNNIIKLYENKNYPEAKIAIKDILSKNSNNLYANYYMAVILEEEKNYPEAISSYKKVLSIDPNYSLAHYGLGLIFDNSEKYQEAVEHYDKFLSLKAKKGEADNYTTFAKNRCDELKKYLNSLKSANGATN